MARSPRFRIARIADLLRQLAFAPADARTRQVQAAEILLAELEPTQTYLASVIEHRITGFRPRAASPRASASIDLETSERADDELYVGEALIADLATLGLRLSEGLSLRPSDRPGGAVPLEKVATRLGVGLRTLQRWRVLGLPLHWIDFDAGRVIGCYEAALAAFLRRRPELVARQRSTRLTPDERRAVVEEARAIRAAEGGSLSSVAATLATRHGRAHETVRTLLERHDARSPSPIFVGSDVDRGPLDEHDRRVIERAWRWGIPLSDLATRLGRTVPAVHRQLMVRRRERLVGVKLEWIELPSFSLPDAEQVILGAPAACSGLRRLTGASDATEVVKSLRDPPARPLAQARPDAHGVRATVGRAAKSRGTRRPEVLRPVDDASAEDTLRHDALVAAWNLLKRRASAAISALPPVPGAAAVDAVERDLRWAALVQQTLVCDALGDAIRRADGWAGRRIELLPVEALRALLTQLVAVCREVIDRVDPSRGNRLDRLVALETDKALARRAGVDSADAPRPRATADRAASAVSIADPFCRLSPWQAWLDPPVLWRERLSSLPETLRLAISARDGLDGHAPRTPRQIAVALRSSPSAAARMAVDAEGMLRTGRRSGAARGGE
jgi:hypothetical protein